MVYATPSYLVYLLATKITLCYIASITLAGLWELCSKFPSLFYSECLFIMLNFILFMLLLLSLFPIYNLNYQAIELYINMQSCTNNTIVRGLRLPPCWYSLSVCNQRAHVIHIALDAPTQNRLVGTRIVSSYSVYLCYFFCIVYVILYIIYALFLIMPKLFLIIPGIPSAIKIPKIILT